MNIWQWFAVEREHRVRYSLGERCRHCGYVNEDFQAQEEAFNQQLDADGELGTGEFYMLAEWHCEGCGFTVPAPGFVVPHGVDPFAEVSRHFEPIFWIEQTPRHEADG